MLNNTSALYTPACRNVSQHADFLSLTRSSVVSTVMIALATAWSSDPVVAAQSECWAPGRILVQPRAGLADHYLDDKLPAKNRIAEIESFFYFAQTEWPKLKPQVKNQIAPRCAKCINSVKFSPLREDGICDICHTEEVPRPVGQENHFNIQTLSKEIESLLRAYQGKAEGRYDALILFSGGKDSTFMLYRLRNEYPELRMLAIMVDNGFASSVALENVKRVVEKIEGVDSLIFKPKSSLFKKTFRYALTHPNEPGCYPIADQFDGDLTFDICRNFAVSLEIPLMIAGMSAAQIQKIFGFHGFESPQKQERQKRTHVAGRDLQDIYTAEEMQYWWDGTAWPEGQIPRVVYPLAAWQYDEQLLQSEVIRLGLTEPGQQNPLITNNDLIPLLMALDVVRFGYSGFEPEFAQLVREGKTDRAIWLNTFEAMEYLVRQGKFVSACIDDTLTRLNLTRGELGIPVALP